MQSKPFGLAVPDYSKTGIKKPYFGDSVWEGLVKLDKEQTFEYIPIEVSPFPDGSEKVIVHENCRDKVVYVVHSLYAEPPRHVMIGAEICDNLIRSDAEKVYLIELFNPYYRQDSRSDREPITARLIGDLYDIAGMKGAFTADPHSKQLAGFFRNLEPLPMSTPLAEHIKKNYDTSNAVVVAPDHGGYQRAEHFANLLEVQLAVMHKERRSGKEVIIKDLLGTVEGKDVFLRDDIIASGGTNIEAAKELRGRGARKIYSVATHLGLYGDAKKLLRESDVHVIGTNTVPHVFSDDEAKYFDIVDVSGIIADVIYTKSQRGSVRRFFKDKTESVKKRNHAPAATRSFPEQIQP